jgi:hypothetical protein
MRPLENVYIEFSGSSGTATDHAFLRDRAVQGPRRLSRVVVFADLLGKRVDPRQRRRPRIRRTNQDTLPRPPAESPMKEFRPLDLGTIRLDRGRGPLTLRAVYIPGREVMRLRSLTLTLQE